MKGKRVFMFFAVSFMIIFAAGATWASSDAIKIGNIACLTGPLSTYGESHRNGVELAVEQANMNGGVLGKQIRLLNEDDQGDPVIGAGAALKLIGQDNVLAIVGPIPSTIGMAVSSIVEDAGVPTVVTGTNPAITPEKHFVSRSWWADDFQGVVMGRFCINELSAKTAAVLYDLGNDYAKSVAEVFIRTFEAEGGKVVTVQTHPSQAVDFRAQLSIIKSKKPDVFFFSDFYNDANLIARQAKDIGIEAVFVGSDGWDSPELDLVSLEGAYYCSHFSKEDPRTETRFFIEEYKKKYNAEPDLLAIMGYDAALMVIDGIRSAGKEDRGAVADAIAKTNGLKAAQGDITLDENGDPMTLPAAILVIKDGQIDYMKSYQPIQ